MDGSFGIAVCSVALDSFRIVVCVSCMIYRLKRVAPFPNFMNPKLLLGLALVLSGGLCGCSSIPQPTDKSEQSLSPFSPLPTIQEPANPLSIIEIQQIEQALLQLKPGMTGKQVSDILDKTPFKKSACYYCDGPMEHYRFSYSLRPGYNLVLVYDQTAEPPRFVRYMNNWKLP